MADYQKKQQIREAIIDIIQRKQEVDIYYLQSNLDRRKTIDGDGVLYSEVLDALYFLDRSGDISYLGHGIYELTEDK